MLVVCERWVETRTDCYIYPSSRDHISTSSSSWLGLLNRGSLMAQSPLSAAGSQFGILSPTDSNCPGHLVILLSHSPPASAVLPLIYTGAFLDWRLGRRSIYNNHPILIFQNSTCGHFLHVRLHPSHTHFTNNAQGQQQQKYEKKLLEQKQNTKILIRRWPSQAICVSVLS